MTEQFADAPVTLKSPVGALCSALLKDDYELKPIVAKKPTALKPAATVAPAAPGALKPVAPTPIPTPIARPVAAQGPLANRG